MSSRSKLLPIVLVAFVWLGVAASPARAQAFLNPYVGADVGGDAGNCPSLFSDCKVKRTAYGVALGTLGGGLLGFEADFGYAPDFFGKSSAFDSNSVLTLMGNLLVSVPAGPIRPYAAIGAGIVRTRVAFTAADVLTFKDSGFGYNLGAGVMLFFSGHLGVRGDFRYFRSGGEISIPGIGRVPASNLSYSRATIGLVLH